MDIASLPEAEQQKLQQLQVQFQQHRAQQEQAQRDQQQQQLQNQQAQVPQPHDPSQYHQYRDQSSQFHHQHRQNHHFAPQFDPRHGYYRSDRANTYQPPGPFQAHDLVARFGSAQHHQNVYYQTQPPPLSSAAYPDLNVAAAAAVALSRLNQIAGTMSAPGNIGHGPMRPQARRPRYPVDGPFKRRRGRNQVPWGHLHGNSSNSELPVAKDPETIDGGGPSAPEAMLPEISSVASSSGKAAANPKPKQSARCELCKVDCTSLEILNKLHNNGKKHKKNVLKAEKSKNTIKSSPAVQGEQKLVAESISEVPQQTETQQNCEENKPKIEDSAVEAGGDGNQVEAEQQKDTGHGEGPTAEINLKADQTETQQNCEENKPMIEDSAVKAVEAGGDGNQVESEQQKDTGRSEGPAAEIKPDADQPDNRRGLRKRKRRTEPSIAKVLIPLVCELCNVKCNTQKSFDCHLAGRKHIHKLKTFHLHQDAAFRPTGLQVLYPPNPISQTLLHPQYHQQQFQIPQSSFPPPAAYAPPPQAHRQALPAASGIDLQLQVATPHPGGQTAVSVLPIAQKPELTTAQPGTT